jgi:hypothetical protein
LRNGRNYSIPERNPFKIETRAEPPSSDPCQRINPYTGKGLYKQIIENNLMQKIEDSQRDEIFEILQISDFSLPSLHTIIYFEDTSNNPLFKKPTMYFPQLFATCRHIGCSFYFAVQYWKYLPTELKSNATNIFIFSSHIIILSHLHLHLHLHLLFIIYAIESGCAFRAPSLNSFGPQNDRFSGPPIAFSPKFSRPAPGDDRKQK